MTFWPTSPGTRRRRGTRPCFWSTSASFPTPSSPGRTKSPVNGDGTRVLMAHHNLYRVWAWTGGHADGDGDLLSVALREAREETGVEHIKPMSTAIASLDILPVWGHVKRGEWVPSHQHLNVTYLLTADDRDPLHFREGENTKVGWLPAEGLLAYTNEWEMDGIYTKLLKRISTYIKF